jgi:hypothetical protein
MVGYALLNRGISPSLQLILVTLSLFGCVADAQKGSIKGAGAPIVGSHIYLFAASTSGASAAPISLLHGAGVTVDPAGNGYVTTNSSGLFSLSGLYAAYCPTSNSLVYMLGLGGNTGYGGNNPASVFVTALAPNCSNLPTAPDVFMNELTTVAAAFALSPFATVSTDSFASSATNAKDMADAFAYANTLVSGYYGTVFTSGPYAKINTLGNVVSECVNTTDTMPCATFFADAEPSGGSAPNDTLQAILDVVLNPTHNASVLYSFYTSVTTDQFYTPALPAAPITWAIRPTITWPTPAAITYGTALSTTQLDATTDVPGGFGYAPGVGVVPALGTQTISTTFTPSDLTSYQLTTNSVVLTVNSVSNSCPVGQ